MFFEGDRRWLGVIEKRKEYEYDRRQNRDCNSKWSNGHCSL